MSDYVCGAKTRYVMSCKDRPTQDSVACGLGHLLEGGRFEDEAFPE